MSDKIITYHISPYHSVQGTQAEIDAMIDKMLPAKKRKPSEH